MQDRVKEDFKQKLPQILDKNDLEDADVINLVLIVGYKIFTQKTTNTEATHILTEAISDKNSIDTLLNYFTEYTNQHHKKETDKKEADKKEAEKKEQEKKDLEVKQKEAAEAKKEEEKSKTKTPPPPVKHSKEQGNEKDENTVPLPQKKPKVEGEPDNPEGEETAPVSLATQLINEGKVRCKYFPFCKNEKCEYFHPTEKCPYFPRCRFADKCMFVHEVCKFEGNCTRNNCFYNHPYKKKCDNPMLEFMKMAMGQTNKRPIRKRKPADNAPPADKPQPVKEDEK